MSRAPVIGGVVLFVIIIVTTVIFMMGGDEPPIGPSPGPSIARSATGPSLARSATGPSLAPSAPVLEAPPAPPAPPAHPSDVTPPPSDETPGDVTTGMLKCVNTRRRGEMGWVGKGRWTTEEKAREVCKDYEYMSLECPMESGFEVFCANDISLAQTLLNRECQGDVEGTELAGGTNAHCTGPYKWGTLDAGGSNRGAVYKI
jgi:hypothetical protein